MGKSLSRFLILFFAVSLCALHSARAQSVCGDGICNESAGENCTACAEDCYNPDQNTLCPVDPEAQAFMCSDEPGKSGTVLGCDSAEDCPTCDVCQTKSCVRDGVESPGECIYDPISSCNAVSDSCCPVGCTAENDPDCRFLTPTPAPTATPIPPAPSTPAPAPRPAETPSAVTVPAKVFLEGSGCSLNLAAGRPQEWLIMAFLGAFLILRTCKR